MKKNKRASLADMEVYFYGEPEPIALVKKAVIGIASGAMVWSEGRFAVVPDGAPRKKPGAAEFRELIALVSETAGVRVEIKGPLSIDRVATVARNISRICESCEDGVTATADRLRATAARLRGPERPPPWSLELGTEQLDAELERYRDLAPRACGARALRFGCWSLRSVRGRAHRAPPRSTVPGPGLDTTLGARGDQQDGTGQGEGAMTKSDKDTRGNGLLAALAIAAVVPTALFRGYVASTLWRWFAEPLGAPAVDVCAAAGLLLLFGMATRHVWMPTTLTAVVNGKPIEITEIKEPPRYVMVRNLVAGFLTPALVLALGWILTVLAAWAGS